MATHQFSGGRLILNPGNFSVLPNCQGTHGGNIQNARVDITPKLDLITAEEWGSAPVDATELDHEIFITVTATGWNEDFLAAFLYGGSTGSGTPSISYPTSTTGRLASVTARTVKLAWIPNNETTDPAWVAYAAIPWSMPKPIYFSGRRPNVVTATFLCVRDSTNRVWASDLLENLSA